MTGSLVGSLGATDNRLLNRNGGFANSQPSSAPYAGCAIAMLTIPNQGEAGCDRRLQRNLTRKRGNLGQKI
jgi:hypothetical protein